MVPLTPDERRSLGLAALTALVTTTVASTVQWLFSEVQRAVQARRDRHAASAAAPATHATGEVRS